MTNWKDMLAMSRYERRGAAVVVALLIVAVAVRCMVAFRPAAEPQGLAATERQFIERNDSLVAARDTLRARQHRVKHRHGNHGHRTPAGSKPAPAKQRAPERSIDPVPSF